MLRDVENKSKLFPLAFQNANISNLALINMVDSFYKRSVLTFIELNFTRFNLGSNIESILLFNAQNIALDLTLLNPLVFEKTEKISVFNRLLNSISQELFKHLKNLFVIELNPMIFRKINKKQGINWIKNINNHVNFNIDNLNDNDIDKVHPKIIQLLAEKNYLVIIMDKILQI